MCNGDPDWKMYDEEGNNPRTGRPWPGKFSSVLYAMTPKEKRGFKSRPLKGAELDPIIPGGSMSTGSTGFSNTTPTKTNTNKSKLTSSDNYQGQEE